MKVEGLKRVKRNLILVAVLIVISPFLFPSTSLMAVGDSTAPVLTSVEVSPQEVKVGDTVEVRVKATDDISGVQSVSVAYYTPSKNRTVHFQMRYDSQDDIWIGSYVIK
ncbi:hypothetical protein, partial [Priestia megaterium]|uniref:hypothetical protein n=1 Tax=Priestia megaterium TaxID=1404 RepID=UPI002EA100E5|nr:hypothetical protein [Priestia megaterium]